MRSRCIDCTHVSLAGVDKHGVCSAGRDEQGRVEGYSSDAKNEAGKISEGDLRVRVCPAKKA